MKNVQTTSELNKRGMIRNSDCLHVSTGWFSPNVRGLSPWRQYAGFTELRGVSQRARENGRRGNVHVKDFAAGSSDVLWQTQRQPGKQTVTWVDSQSHHDVLEKHYCIINTFWWNLNCADQYGQAGSQRWLVSTRPCFVWYHSVKRNLPTAPDNKAWMLTVHWNNLLPLCVTRTCHLPSSLTEDNFLCPEATSLLLIWRSSIAGNHPQCERDLGAFEIKMKKKKVINHAGSCCQLWGESWDLGGEKMSYIGGNNNNNNNSNRWNRVMSSPVFLNKGRCEAQISKYWHISNVCWFDWTRKSMNILDGNYTNNELKINSLTQMPSLTCCC